MIKKNSLVQIYLIRGLIILFWMSIILAFLYLPHVIRRMAGRRSIDVFTWVNMLDEQSVLEFEGQTGIKVNLSYYDSNEELLTKLRVSKGRGYDMLIATDYGIQDLIKYDLVQPIDRGKLNFWQELEPQILNKSYDPGNQHTIPYFWDIYGLGINLDSFGGELPEASWKLAFEPQISNPRVAMVDDCLESTLIAGQYLFENVKYLSTDQLNAIKKVLIKQKPFLEAYTDLRGDYFLVSGTSAVVVSQRAYIYKAMQEDPRVRFVFPKEGSFVIIDNFLLTKSSQKSDLVYQFINFIYQKEIVQRSVASLQNLSMRRDVLQEMDLDYLGGYAQLMDPERFNRMAFFETNATKAQLSKLWMDVKAN